jgi:hypothetical protein
MNLESFDSEWCKTYRYVSVAEPAFEVEASQIQLKCLHCKQDPFTVYLYKKGGWNIGTFTRHLNTEKVCQKLGLENTPHSSSLRGVIHPGLLYLMGLL